MASQLIKGKNIDVSKVSVSQPRVLDNGAKLVYVNYNNSRFNIQTPWMELAWDMSCYTEGPYPKYSMELSFRGADDDEEIAAFLEKFNELDQRLIDVGLEESVAFFKKKTSSREVIEGFYNPIVKVSKDRDTGEPDGKWPSTFRVKIPFRDGKFQPKFYTDGTLRDVNDGETNLSEMLVKRCRARCILQCVGIWVASGNYMCQWQLQKAELEVPENSSNVEFMPDSDVEDEINGDEDNDPVMLDDSDNEEDSPPPAAKPKGRKLKVKKST